MRRESVDFFEPLKPREYPTSYIKHTEHTMKNEPLFDSNEKLDESLLDMGAALEFAVGAIDDIFEPGYAKKNPQLVAAMLTAIGNDSRTALISERLSEIIDFIPQIVEELTR